MKEKIEARIVELDQLIALAHPLSDQPAYVFGWERPPAGYYQYHTWNTERTALMDILATTKWDESNG